MKKNLLKKLLCLSLSTIFLSAYTIPTMANDLTDNIEQSTKIDNLYDYSIKDIKKLEPYITVKNNIFEFDVEKAIKDGFDKDLVEGQKAYLDFLNSEAEKGIFEIQQNLEIKINTKINNLYENYSCDGYNSFEVHWWGYSRYADNCETNRIINDLNSAAGIGTTAGGLAAIAAIVFPESAGVSGGIAAGATVTAGYEQLLASRMAANNRGKGVFIEMTWVGIFDITPQW